MDDIFSIVSGTVDQENGELFKLGQAIWNQPELAFNEHFAHALLTDFLENTGFVVEKSFKLETAFRATYHHSGSNLKPNIAVLCEYDALPGIGHACGHNLIAEAGVAAGLAMKAAMIDKDLHGTLTVLGCPAEEGLCGKADLLRLGAFDGVDAAVMVHPSQTTLSKPNYVSMTPLSIKYHGKASHAASYPWEGLNALDAAVACYTNISLLRQQMKPAWRVHGVIKNGGAQPNIIPEETELEFYLRTPNDADMVMLKQKVEGCVQGAVLATGCSADYQFGQKSYSHLVSNNILAELFEKHAASFGIEMEKDEEKRRKFGGSTDMGNVSQVIPSLHPKYNIGTTASNHSKEFTAVAGSEQAHKCTMDVAKALAMTVLELYCNPHLVEEVKADFKRSISGS